jgi:hypothetical protein
MRARVTAWLNRAPFAWPRPFDALAERWARLRPRTRTLLTVAACVALVALVDARVRAAEARWGGAPVDALIATRALAVGVAPEDLRGVQLPPGAVPADALHAIPADAVLAFALPAGAVLTAAHLDVQGPAAGLPAQERAVPVPVEAGWGIAAGGWVDVWVLGGGEDASTLVASSRPVLEVRDREGQATALVGLRDDEVAATTGGLTLGGVLLTHAPPPS